MAQKNNIGLPSQAGPRETGVSPPPPSHTNTRNALACQLARSHYTNRTNSPPCMDVSRRARQVVPVLGGWEWGLLMSLHLSFVSLPPGLEFTY